MAIPSVYDRVKETSTTTGTGSLTLGGAATGYRTFNNAVGVGNLTYYCVENATLGEWEVGLGTISNSTTLARTVVIKSSNSDSLVNFSAGTKNVFCTVPAQQFPLIIPAIAGGRLTLTSNTPVTSSDVTGATSIFYTPYTGNYIALPAANERWTLNQFSQVTLAIGTVTSGLPYDVYGFDSSGTLTLEKLAWTNGTTRATDLTLLDGVWTKNGDATRRYLGTFYSTSTTTTEDSLQKRFLWNVNNQVLRRLHTCPGYSDNNTNTSYTTSSTSVVEANSGTNSRTEFVLGLAQAAEALAHFVVLTPATGGAAGGIGIDSVTDVRANCQENVANIVRSMSAKTGAMFAVGYHYFTLLISSQVASAATFFADGSRTSIGSTTDYKDTYLEGTVWS